MECGGAGLPRGRYGRGQGRRRLQGHRVGAFPPRSELPRGSLVARRAGRWRYRRLAPLEGLKGARAAGQGAVRSTAAAVFKTRGNFPGTPRREAKISAANFRRGRVRTAKRLRALTRNHRGARCFPNSKLAHTGIGALRRGREPARPSEYQGLELWAAQSVRLWSFGPAVSQSRPSEGESQGFSSGTSPSVPARAALQNGKRNARNRGNGMQLPAKVFSELRKSGVPIPAGERRNRIETSNSEVQPRKAFRALHVSKAGSQIF